MCTVSFIPAKDKIFLTSNRDEKALRLQALAPAEYTVNNNTLVFPKDGAAGGSWLAMHKNGNACILLNGAFENHIKKEKYRRSRGLIFLDIFSAENAVKEFDKIDLTNIEPFTLVLFQKNKLFELRWDEEEKKHKKELDVTKSYIWSSATLYTKDIVEKRETWFEEFLTKHPTPTLEEILHFHQFSGDGDESNDFNMKREDSLQTISITGITVTSDTGTMLYKDLLNHSENEIKLNFEKPVKTNLFSKIKHYPFFIRLLHWEYWSFNAIYMPIVLYWVYLFARARGIFFFNASNPTITSGGFLMESKNEIYKLMPEETYPKTMFLRGGATGYEVNYKLQNSPEFSFPLIAKPDIGLKGIGVEKIETIEELKKYADKIKVDFLLQEFVPYKNEVGIFYCRYPNKSKGFITGIVGKEFLKIVGDGKSTIKELVAQTDRGILQIKNLAKHPNINMDEVLNEGEEKELVPYGNHARGAKFLDLSDKISDKLENVINEFAKKVEGFYYGRLDIRFESWEDLEEGKNYSVIELNGSGSEPTHIYDPTHSLFFAWKEIIKHWDILTSISIINNDRGVQYMKIQDGLNMLFENKKYFKKLKSCF